MKSFFLVLVMVFMVGNIFAVQPVRKPFIQVAVDGKPTKSGEVLTVDPSQKLVVTAEFMGGRRDFCKFPDIYADIAGSAQILSRGNDGINYQVNGILSKWKLLDEKVSYTGDEFVKISSGSNSASAELSFSSSPFSQSFLKISITANWEFSQGDKTSKEENTAEAILYFKVAGASDTWYSSHDVQASGMKNEKVLEKLNLVQAECDSIENNINKLRFSTVQHSIKTLRANIDTLKLTIDEVKATNPAFQTKIVFIGLPSDNPFFNLSKLNLIKTNWNLLDPMLQGIKPQLESMPVQPTDESKAALLKLIESYADWLSKFPENTPEMLSLYFPEISRDDVWIPASVQLVAEQKKMVNYAETLLEFKTFIDKRIELAPDETQKINSATTKLQAVKLFDGMLRSYYSSITWAEWKNTRE